MLHVNSIYASYMPLLGLNFIQTSTLDYDDWLYKNNNLRLAKEFYKVTKKFE